MGASASISGHGDGSPGQPRRTTLSALSDPDAWVITTRPDGSEVHRPGPGNSAAMHVTPPRWSEGSIRAAPLEGLRISASTARTSRLLQQMPSRPSTPTVDDAPPSASVSDAPQLPLQRAPLALGLSKAADPFLVLQQYLSTDPTLPPPSATDAVCCTESAGVAWPGSEGFCDVDRTPGWRSHVHHLLFLWDAVSVRGYQVTLFSGRTLQRGRVSTGSPSASAFDDEGAAAPAVAAAGPPLYLADYTFHSDETLEDMELRAFPPSEAGGISSLRFTTSYGNVFEAGAHDAGATHRVHLPVCGTFLKGFHGTLQSQGDAPDVVITLGACTSARNVAGIAQAEVSAAPAVGEPGEQTVVVSAPGATDVEYGMCCSSSGGGDDPPQGGKRRGGGGGGGASGGSDGRPGPPLRVLINGEWTLLQAFPQWTRIAPSDDNRLVVGTAGARQGAAEHDEGEQEGGATLLPFPALRVTCMRATTAGAVVNYADAPHVLAMLAARVEP